MFRLLTAVLLFASFNVVADDCEPPEFSPAPPIPTKCDLNQLNNSEVADADTVMQNFNTLGDAIDALPTPPTNCTTDQIIKWDGSAWVCASRAIVEIICDPLLQCKAYCPAGTTVVSGGCSHSLPQASSAMVSAEDGPLPDLDGWICTATFSEDGGLVITRAICQ